MVGTWAELFLSLLSHFAEMQVSDQRKCKTIPKAFTYKMNVWQQLPGFFFRFLSDQVKKQITTDLHLYRSSPQSNKPVS